MLFISPSADTPHVDLVVAAEVPLANVAPDAPGRVGAADVADELIAITFHDLVLSF